MGNKYLFFVLLILFFLVCFLIKINRKNSNEIQSNNDKDSAQNIQDKSNSIESEDSIKTVVEHPVKMKNSFLNPNDDFGTLQKGVVIENQTYEYEVSDNDSSNFTILEAGDEPREIGE